VRDLDYIREVHAFYNELEINPLSSSAISLWHALWHIRIKSGSKDKFTVPVGTLSLKSGLSDRTVSNARNELKTKDYITFQSRGGNKAALYQILSLSAYISDNTSDNVSDKRSDNTSDNVSALKNLKDITTTPTTREDHSNLKIDQVYTKVFGTLIMTPLISEYIRQLKSKGYSDYFIKELMLETGQSGNKPSLVYMESIANRWIKDGIKSREEAKEQKSTTKNNPKPDSQTEKVRKFNEIARELENDEIRSG
jgi:DnaD/phage-associated family protein